MSSANTRINFADVEEQKEFTLLPQGKYDVQITDLTESEAGDQAENPGCRILKWEFEIFNGEYANRKIWDRQACTEKSLWKPKALFTAIGIDTSELSYDLEEKTFYQSEEEMDLTDLVGERVTAGIGIKPQNRGKDGKEYGRQNRINTFHPYEEEDADLLS